MGKFIPTIGRLASCMQSIRFAVGFRCLQLASGADTRSNASDSWRSNTPFSIGIMKGASVCALLVPFTRSTQRCASRWRQHCSTETREGSVAAIQVADSTSIPPGRAESLTREAIDNLKTWRLEPARRQDTFRVTYSYEIDSSLKEGEVNDPS
jgi:hypothetical protein